MISSKDDYGSMSSVHIRQILEKELGLKLDNFKKFVDATIFQFYNQLVECATQILPYLYLGTEWNASNYDSLQTDRVTHILNISSEVDNFFPDTFKYLNIRVLDVEETDLLKEFDRTNRFIQEAKEEGTSCLVHCKMGVSRSATVVLAYLMKEFNWTYEQTFQFTKQKRNCINPNDGFKQQLATYESILNAHRAKYNLFEPQVDTVSSSNANIQTSACGSGVKINTNSNNSVPIESNDCLNGVVKEAIMKIKSSPSGNQSSLTVSPNQPLSTSPLNSNANLNTTTTSNSPSSNTVSVTNSSLEQLQKKSKSFNFF
jgi:protein-tyrosine phosphatase